MALSNWLGKDEWSACWWLGMREIRENDAPGGSLGAVLQAGIGKLAREGYSFRGIRAEPDGSYEKVSMQDDCPASVLADMVTGNFNPREYAGIAVTFCEAHLPGYDVSWLRDAVSQVEEDGYTAHG